MSLEDKIINPMAPALPGQGSEPLPEAGKKRRKGGATAGTSAGKAKKSDLEDEVGGDTTAVLTLGADQARRPQKKMLVESASEGATLSFAGPTIRRETPRVAPAVPVAIAPAASAAKSVPAEDKSSEAPPGLAAMPEAEVEETAPTEVEVE